MDSELKQCRLDVAKGRGDVMVVDSRSLKNGRKVFAVQEVFG